MTWFKVQWSILEIWNSRDDMKTWEKDLENGNQVGISNKMMMMNDDLYGIPKMKLLLSIKSGTYENRKLEQAVRNTKVQDINWNQLGVSNKSGRLKHKL